MGLRQTSAYRLDLLTYCRFASQFLVCDSSAAFLILDFNPLQHFLSCASSAISATSLLECKISVEDDWQVCLWSSSQFVTIRDTIRSSRFICRNIFVFVEYDQRDSSEPIEFVITVAFLGIFFKAMCLFFSLGI